MHKVILLFLVFVPALSFASVSRGVELIAKGQKEEGCRHLEKYFESATKDEKAKISLILSRIVDVKLENSPTYYAKYSLKYLREKLSLDEIALLNTELADYYLSLGNLNTAQKYYLAALKIGPSLEINYYANYRLAWVSYNNEKLSLSREYLFRSLKSSSAELKNDALYLLGKITISLKSDVKEMIAKDILNNEFFLRGLAESSEYVKLTELQSDFSKLYYSVKERALNSCESLKQINTKMPADSDIPSSEVQSFFKRCLVENKSLVSNVVDIITINNWQNDMSEVLAMSHLINGNKVKACESYKNIFDSKNLATYRGLVLSCPLSKLNLTQIANIPASCDDYSLFKDIDENTIRELKGYSTVANQALLLASLYKVSSVEDFKGLSPKLRNCSKQKDVVAHMSLSSDAHFNVADLYDEDCEKNSMTMLKARYLHHLYSGAALNQQTVKCLSSRLNSDTKKEILSSVKFNKIQKNSCSFSFDCIVKDISLFVNDGARIQSSNKQYKRYFIRLNTLRSAQKILARGLKVTNIEKIYSKIKYAKRAFISPIFFNDTLIKKASDEYNSLIDNFIVKLKSINGLEQEQIAILEKALVKEKVVL
jgi:hypothetical protein